MLLSSKLFCSLAPSSSIPLIILTSSIHSCASHLTPPLFPSIPQLSCSLYIAWENPTLVPHGRNPYQPTGLNGTCFLGVYAP